MQGSAVQNVSILYALSDLEFAGQAGQQCDYGETSAACCSKLFERHARLRAATMRLGLLALQQNGGTNLPGLARSLARSLGKGATPMKKNAQDQQREERETDNFRK